MSTHKIDGKIVKYRVVKPADKEDARRPRPRRLATKHAGPGR